MSAKKKSTAAARLTPILKTAFTQAQKWSIWLREIVLCGERQTVFWKTLPPPMDGLSEHAQSWGLDPRQFDSVASEEGLPAAAGKVARGIVSRLFALAEIDPEAAHQLLRIAYSATSAVSKIEKQRGEISKRAEEIPGFPVVWDPLEKEAGIAPQIQGLRIGAKAGVKPGESRPRKDSPGKGASDISTTGPLCVNLRYAIYQCRQEQPRRSLRDDPECVPWMKEAWALSADDQNSASWFAVAWKALLWATNNKPEDIAELRAVAQRSADESLDKRSLRSHLRMRLGHAWTPRFSH